MSYGWIIDKDHICKGEADGVMGPCGIDPVIERNLLNGEGEKQRLYDDDDELYYEGRILVVDDENNTDNEDDFGMLEDYGTPNAGCTYAKYLHKGEWKHL